MLYLSALLGQMDSQEHIGESSHTRLRSWETVILWSGENTLELRKFMIQDVA